MEPIKCFLVEPTKKKKKRIVTLDNDEPYELKDTLYRRTDTGELQPLNDFGPGAMWFAPWLDNIYKPQLKHVLVVKTPGGDWIIDSQASNCTKPQKKVGEDGWTARRQEDHHCWILHGEPPNVTVDKDGNTCEAGGGSIVCGGFHGFLRNGFLVNA